MNTLKRRKISLLCLILAGIALISGCGSQSGNALNSDASAQGGTTEKQKDKKAQFEISNLKIYDSDGTCTLEVSFEYNEEGKVVHQVQNEYASDMDIMDSEMVYTYPEPNRRIRTYIDKATGKRTQADETVFNDAGKIWTESSFNYDENGSQENDYSQTDYFYDENENLIRRERYDTSKIGANVTSKQIDLYTYDKDGNRISEQQKLVCEGQADRIWLDCTYEYDKNGNKIRATNAVTDKYTSSPIIYDYNKNNQLIKETNYQATTPDVLKDYYIYEYDENDNLIKSTYYSADDKIISYTVYEYIEIGAVSQAAETAASAMSLYQRWHIDGTAAAFITFKTQEDSAEARCEINDFDLFAQQEVDGNTSTGAVITDTTIEINYRPDEYITFTYAFQKDGTLKLTNQETGKTFSMHLA